MVSDTTDSERSEAKENNYKEKQHAKSFKKINNFNWVLGLNHMTVKLTQNFV